MAGILGVGVCIGFSLGFASAVLVSRNLFDYLRFRWKLKSSLTQMQREAAQAELRAQQLLLIQRNAIEAKTLQVDKTWAQRILNEHAERLGYFSSQQFGPLDTNKTTILIQGFVCGLSAAAADLLGEENVRTAVEEKGPEREKE
jgi:hypothetical protein